MNEGRGGKKKMGRKERQENRFLEEYKRTLEEDFNNGSTQNEGGADEIY